MQVVEMLWPLMSFWPCICISKFYVFLISFSPTSNDLWGQNILVYSTQGLSSYEYLGPFLCLSMQKCIPSSIFQIWPFCLTSVTSNDLWGQNILVYSTQGYHHMSIWGLSYSYLCKKNASLVLFYIFDLFLTFCYLQWPLMTSEVKIL